MDTLTLSETIAVSFAAQAVKNGMNASLEITV